MILQQKQKDIPVHAQLTTVEWCCSHTHLAHLAYVRKNRKRTALDKAHFDEF